MRTNIDLNEGLVNEAMRLTGARTKKAVVHQALVELVRSRTRLSLLDLDGKIRFADGYDHRALRTERP